MSQPETLYLIDASSYLFRAYHALPPLSNAQGEPTGALYGVANMIRAWLNEHRPRYIAAVFDASGRNFRHDMYPEYKANRPPMPDDLRVQIAPLLELVEVLGIPLVQVSGVEADDVIGTLARDAKEQGMRVLISTSDKDLAQLVDDRVTLINTMTATVLDPAGVENKFGVRPTRMVDYLALVGDTVDNVPGVHKCGPKTALKWLQAYGDLNGVIAHAGEIGGKIGEYLRQAVNTLGLSRDLVTIRTDVALDRHAKDLQLQQPDSQRLKTILQRYDFSSWLADLDDAGDDPDNDASVPDTRYECILEASALERWIGKLKQAGCFALDCETTGLDPMMAELVGLSFACQNGEAAYLPMAHTYPGAPQQLDRAWALEQLRPIFEDPAMVVIGQHFKYDLIVLHRHGVEVAGWRYDTMLESYILNAAAGRHDMDSLAERYLGRRTIHYEDIAGKGAKQILFSEVGLEQASEYAAEDADITLQLHNTLWPKLQAHQTIAAVFTKIEMPLAPILAQMERRGVLVEADALKALSREFAKRMAELEAEAHQMAGRRFNLASPKQLQQLLFEDQGLPVKRKTPKGQPSTAEDVLEQLARDYPLPRVIMQHRGLSKLKSTYTDKLPEQINPYTGRIHTSYHQAVASTGRLSSNDPNLQNIPIRTTEGRRIRQTFVAAEGCLILSADYSQIELRIMAHLSGDEGLRQAFQEGRDIHAATAAEVFGGDADTIEPDKRRAAKAINFGLIYGMSAFGLARNLGIGRNEAQEYIDTYFNRYPGVKDYMESTRKKAHQMGYVETLFGRRLHLNEIQSRNYQRRQAAERAAINAPMQGTAADIIKRAMIEVDAWLTSAYGTQAIMTMQVHDELVLEVQEDAVEDVMQGIRERMSKAAELTVPLVVDVGVGKNWDVAH